LGKSEFCGGFVVHSAMMYTSYPTICLADTHSPKGYVKLSIKKKRKEKKRIKEKKNQIREIFTQKK
jgi:hypothetical protein